MPPSTSKKSVSPSQGSGDETTDKTPTAKKTATDKKKPAPAKTRTAPAAVKEAPGVTAVRAFAPVTPWHKRPYDVLLFGPTGFTGAKVLERLSRMDISVAVAGRNAEALSKLVEDNDNVQLAMLAEVEDHASMVKAFSEARVVINCVGPFLDFGAQTVEAAIEARTWLVDPSVEQPWMNQLCRRHREISESGIVVVTGLAAMPGLGDLAIYLLTPAFEEVSAIRVGYMLADASPAKGTLKAIARHLGEPGLVYEEGFWRVARLGESNYSFRRNKEKFSAISYPVGEVVLAPRHMEVEDVTGYLVTQVPGAMLLKHSLPQLMRLVTPEVGRSLSEMLGRLPESIFHPDEHHNHCATLIDMEGTLGGEPFTLRAGISADDAYDTTADLLAYGAYFLVFTPPKNRGVLSPAQAFDAYRLVNSLSQRGIAIDGALTDVLQGVPTRVVVKGA